MSSELPKDISILSILTHSVIRGC